MAASSSGTVADQTQSGGVGGGRGEGGGAASAEVCSRAGPFVPSVGEVRTSRR